VQSNGNRKNGLSALLVAQFMGAANDNILKTLLSFAVVRGIWEGRLGEGGQGLVALCLFVPFILFSGWAGPLADRYSKRTIAVAMKGVEVPLALAAGIGFLTSNLWLTLCSMILLATQSTFFSPAKYGMIPEIVRLDRVSRANGILNMTTNIAVIFGMLVAGSVSDGLKETEQLLHLWLPGVSLLSVAVIGFLAIVLLPPLSPTSETTKLTINPLETYIKTAKWAWGSPLIAGALSWSLFYLIATLALLVVTELGDLLQVSDAKISYILATLGVAVGLGSLTTGFVSKSRIRIDVSRIGAICMGVVLCIAGFVSPNYLGTVVLMFCLGFSAGLYAVPLQSLMQMLPNPDHRGRVLASCNALSFLFMGVGSLAYWLMRPLFGDHPQHLFVVCGGIAFLAWYSCKRIPSVESHVNSIISSTSV
jgi:acyl-[acyl-carrier-protein]-phospholipid O-acyltransferase/long-chain-fatty-acid--[acyl-carrier-protein] ligase